MQQEQNVRKDMEDLVNLFLSPEFKPLRGKEDSGLELNKLVYEAEVVDEIEDSSGDELPFKHNDYFQKKCGQALAKLGDEFMKDAFRADDRSVVNPLDKVKESLKHVAQLSCTSSDEKVIEREKEKAWETFKCVMMDSTTDSGVKNAYNTLGAFLLAINGLANMGSAGRSLARIFSVRFIHETKLDKDIEKMGGLNAFMKEQLD